MMEIGMKIYFEKATGNVVVNTGERTGRLVVETTEDQDFATYKALAERVRDTIGVVKLKYGQYGREFAECSGYRVDPETLELVFTYPGEIPVEVIAERMSTVEAENARLALELTKADTRLELNEESLEQNKLLLEQTQTRLEQAEALQQQTQIQLDQAEAEQAKLLLSLVEGGIL